MGSSQSQRRWPLPILDPGRAERIAQGITTGESGRTLALADVAVTLANTDPDRAERIAQAITDDYRKVATVAKIAEAWNQS